MGRLCRDEALARLILDTTALVDAERDGLGALDELIGDEDYVVIAAVSVAELVVGGELGDAKRRARRGVLDQRWAFSVESYDPRRWPARTASCSPTPGAPAGRAARTTSSSPRRRGLESARW